MKGRAQPRAGRLGHAASLLAIDVYSDAKRAYLRALATALRLDADAVSFLHRTTCAPTA